jgi:hypothetical protein
MFAREEAMIFHLCTLEAFPGSPPLVCRAMFCVAETPLPHFVSFLVHLFLQSLHLP